MNLVQNEIQIIVFTLNNTTFQHIGNIDNYTAITFGRKFVGCHDFELWAPIIPENARFLKVGNVLWVGGNKAAIIEVVTETSEDVSDKKFDVKGRTLEVLLKNRILWGRRSYYNKYVSSIMYSLVNESCINPTNIYRKIPFLYNDSDDNLGGKIITQQTGGEIYDILEGLSNAYGLGFFIDFDANERVLTFRVASSRNFTINQVVNPPVVLSGEMEDILKSEYYINIKNEKVLALVAGEGEGSERVYVVTGDTSKQGFDRKELWVDARDLQSTQYDDSTGETVELTPEEYEALLVQRGNEKLGDCKVVENYTAVIRPTGGMYSFGVDYDIGDIITIQDTQLGITLDAKIMGVVEEFTDKYNLTLEIGFGLPSFIRRLRTKFGY